MDFTHPFCILCMDLEECADCRLWTMAEVWALLTFDRELEGLFGEIWTVHNTHFNFCKVVFQSCL